MGTTIIATTLTKLIYLVFGLKEKFKKMSISKIRSFGKKKSIIYDAKYLFKALHTDGRL